MAWALNYKNLLWADGDTLIKSGPGHLNSFIINQAVTTTTQVVLWDGLASTGTIIATIEINTATNGQMASALHYGCQFRTGLFVDLSATTTDLDVTLVYN